MRLLSLLLLAVGLSAHAATFTVTNLQDAATNPPIGSLRERLAAAASAPGPDTVLFDPAIQGGMITLVSQIVITDTVGVTLDGGPKGMTIHGSVGTNSDRIFKVEGAAIATLRRLNLTGGRFAENPTGTDSLLGGGAILNSGTLTLRECALYGNSSESHGGAIMNSFIEDSGFLTLESCTVYGNVCDQGGGGIFDLGRELNLRDCTVAGNGAVSGGGIAYSSDTISITLINTIVASNFAVLVPDMRVPDIEKKIGSQYEGTITYVNEYGGVTALGNNWIPAHGQSAAPSPNLRPLGNYGGPTQTAPPTVLSRVIDAADPASVTATTDQRGFPRSLDGNATPGARPDIGAAEFEIYLDSPGSGIQGLYVTTAADELDPPGVDGAGLSLREAIRDVPAGGYVMFDPTLFNDGEADVIRLSSALGPIVVDKAIVLNGGFTPASVSISGEDQTGIFTVTDTGSLDARYLTLRNGFRSPGGAILVQFGDQSRGNLILKGCTLRDNTASASGGAIANGGTASLTSCTLTGNRTTSAVDSGGGAIACSNGSATTLTHCTVSGNLSASTLGGGGIQVNFPNTTVNLAYSIVAGNTASLNADISRVDGVVTAAVNNLIGSNASVESTVFAGPLVGTVASPLIPQLAPLANNGGRTWTMALQDNSPAINRADGSGAVRDQRESRVVGTPDLGAYETRIHNTLRVTSLADSGSGSLRAALAFAATMPGADEIYFDPSLSGHTILLNTQLSVSDSAGVLLDASNLYQGLRLRASGGNNRIFLVNAGARLTLRGLILRGGRLTGSEQGGALRNNGGFVTLDRCTLLDNRVEGDAGNGGAIFNQQGNMILDQCTLTENIARNEGGAIFAFQATTTLRHCTISSNRSNGFGGGISNRGNGGNIAAANLTLANCIVAGNFAAPSNTPDFQNTAATLTRLGNNLVGSFSNTLGGTDAGPGAIAVNPRLGTLNYFGGPTPTMCLLAGSPALDAAGVIDTAPAFDQRGFRRPSGLAADLGAFEAQISVSSAPPLPGQAGAQGAFVLSGLPGLASGVVTNHARSVGFNFAGGIDGSATAGGLLDAGDYAGVPEFAQPNWNNLLTEADGNNDGSAPQAQSKLDSAGADLAGIKLWWRAPNTWAITSPNPLPLNPTPDQLLLNGYLDSNDNGDGSTATNLRGTPRAQPYFAVSGLPPDLTLGGYKVLVYADGEATDGRKASYWLNSNRGEDPRNVAGEYPLTDRVYLSDTGNTNAYARARGNSEATATPGANVVQFEGRTESAFTVRAEEHTLRSPLNAVQIVRNPWVIVTTREDENDPIGTLGTGFSLREALRDAPEGAGVIFDPNVFTGELPDTNVLRLRSELGALEITRGLTVDASNIPGGITLDAEGGGRVLHVRADREVDISLVSGSTATQSTTYDPGYPATNALDQRLDTFTHTLNADSSPSWTVDFQREVPLSRIVLHNRQDCCGARLSDISVNVLGVNDELLASFNPLNAGNAQNGPPILEVRLGRTVPARKIVVNRYASMGMADPGVLTLSEVKVFVPNDVVLRGLTLREGLAVRGAGLLNEANLRLENCTLEFNRATGDGGGIANDGKLELRSCTIANNTATANGGGVHNTSQLAIDHCTVTGNRAEGSGGALYSAVPSVELTHCTVTGNSAGTSAGGLRVIGLGLAAWDGGGPGGGFALAAAPAPSVSAALAYSIVRGNGTGTSPNLGANDIVNADATLQYLGTNIVGVVVHQNSGFASGPAPLDVDPRLGPLQDYGGPTRTMALRPGSPARNQGGGSYALSDQRAYPAVQIPDLGAYEAGLTTSNFFAWVWETLPADTPAEQMDPYADYDGDNASNADEFFMRTDPRSPASVHEVAELVREPGGGIQFVFATQSGLRYQLQRTTGLDSFGFNLWTNVGVPLNGTGSPLSFTLTPELLATFGDGGIFRVTILFQ